MAAGPLLAGPASDAARNREFVQQWVDGHEGKLHRVDPQFASRPRNLTENPYKSLRVDPDSGPTHRTSGYVSSLSSTDGDRIGSLPWLLYEHCGTVGEARERAAHRLSWEAREILAR